MTTPPPVIDAENMALRMRDYGLSTLNQVVTMMMSGVYATSALALADILRTPDDFWVRLTLWLSLTMASTFMITRLLHLNALYVRPNAYFLPLQLVSGFLIAAAFACLPLSTGGSDGWRTAVVIFALTIPLAAVASRSLPQWLKPENYSFDLQPLVAQRLDGIHQTIRTAPVFYVVTLVNISIAWLTRGHPDPWNWILVAFNAVSIGATVFGIWQEIQGFRRFLDGVEQLRVASHQS